MKIYFNSFAHESCLVAIYKKMIFCVHSMLIHDPLSVPHFLLIAYKKRVREIDAWLLTRLIPYKIMKRNEQYIFNAFFLDI